MDDATLTLILLTERDECTFCREGTNDSDAEAKRATSTALVLKECTIVLRLSNQGLFGVGCRLLRFACRIAPQFESIAVFVVVEVLRV